ncbi:TMV resistance protein N-like isoform X2 [Camellia sinensis]|uniref:TMV resistance protein N-like isoform X2 n=1 Tax=Camellia sinensis TaxID=4442 RepID=UPI001035D26E|nr:TMV resistance protein N-like isoform X2 [Camellia sinensis]
MASSSVPSSSRPQYTYDVFLSFRGEDTRDNIVSHFYTLLAQKGINTFKDDEKLERGKVISPELRRAIRESRFLIVFLSKNYASSRWCLDELVEALECSNTTVYPIFYHVDPSEVRRQRGSFGEGFDELVSKQGVLGMENVQRWRNALEQVGNLSGWHYPCDTIIRSESMFIQEVVEILFTKLNCTYSSVVKDLVGMDSHMQKVIELLGLGMGDARVVGIWGMGGIGKTTISRVVYDCISYQFQGCSFIENVREVSEKCGLKTLQEQLISEILIKKDLKVRSDAHAVHMIRNMICRKKVLIVLDDVDESTNLEKLVGQLDCLNSGSRIIITTRNKHVFSRCGITHIYEVEELREDEAMELFKSKAFGNYQHMEGYQELVRRAVKYAKGVPLALKVLGSFLRGRNEDEWESSLNRLKKSSLKEVLQVLRISYDALKSEEQDIFLDIACFFKGKDKNEVIKILESCGFDPIIGIDVLVQKSLITISGNKLLMHDLIQQLGWYIVIQQSREEPGERTRLWRDEDIKNVLMNNTGTNKVEGIVMQYNSLSGLDPKHIQFLKQLKLRPEAFAKMSNLRILKICCMHLSKDLKYISNNLRYLDWLGYPMKYMPSTFQPEHLVELHLTYSRIEQLWEGTMHLRKLRIMNLSHSTYLKKSPYFAGVPNLERLILKGCTGLVNLHPSIGVLKRLICLNLKDCKCLKSLPDNICQLKDLGKLTLSGCSKLDKLPQDLGVLDCLYRHYADGTAIRQLPSSIGSIRRLMNLRSLTLRGCKGLSSNSWSSFFLPSILQRERDMASELAASSRLNSLQKLDLSYCNLKSIPTAICHIDSLEILDLSGNNMERLPARMNQLSRLRALWLSGCKKVQELPEISSKIVAIFAKNCSSLRTICSLSKYNYFSTLHFDNCFKLIENKQNNILTEKVLSNRFQRDASRFKIGFPGREIPKWFSHQGRGPSISFQLPPHWFNNRFLGFAFAAVGFRKDESAYFAIKMRWKCYVTKRIITSSDVLISSVNFGNILVEGIPRGAFLPFAEDCMEELKEGGIEVEVSVSNIFGVDTVSNLTLVEKVGVHVIYKEAEEQALTSRYNSQDSNNINMDVFHGDLDRSAGVQVGSSSSSATTSKRRRDDDLNDNHYNAAAGASGSPGIDDQEDHLNNLNSKRLRLNSD